MKKFQLATFLFLSHVIVSIHGHARLLVPPARSSAWREDKLRFPTFVDDNQMNCGGFNVQWRMNGGRCGVCGEQYNAPKKFEKGGMFYRGINVRSYKPGVIISITTEITANHKGYYEFRLCNVDNLSGDATQDCLDKIVLKDRNGNTRIQVGSYTGLMTVQMKLPNDLTCKHCVLQWKYNAGNSWGVDRSGKQCTGCGPQEQFFGCADISITNNLNQNRIDKIARFV